MATFIWFCVAAVVVFLDQLSKYLTVLYLKPVGTFPILQDALHLTYVENRGAAFGMLANNRWVFMIVSSVAIAALSVYLILSMRREVLAERAAAMQETGQTSAQESDGDSVPDEAKDAPAADPDTGNPTETPPDGGAPTA